MKYTSISKNKKQKKQEMVDTEAIKQALAQVVVEAAKAPVLVLLAEGRREKTKS